jgi:hypothetical protein
MNKKIFVLALASLITILAAYAEEMETAAGSAMLKDEARAVDFRAQKLNSYLASQGSPLADFAKDFIDASDHYGLDWRLLPAIAGVESTFGKQIPAGSYNAYGWNNGVWHFSGWPESIDYVSRALKERYFDRGLDTVAKMAPVYAPPSKTWAGKVNFFMEKIDSYSPDIRLETLSLTL